MWDSLAKTDTQKNHTLGYSHQPCKRCFRKTSGLAWTSFSSSQLLPAEYLREKALYLSEYPVTKEDTRCGTSCLLFSCLWSQWKLLPNIWLDVADGSCVVAVSSRTFLAACCWSLFWLLDLFFISQFGVSVGLQSIIEVNKYLVHQSNPFCVRGSALVVLPSLYTPQPRST